LADWLVLPLFSWGSLYLFRRKTTASLSSFANIHKLQPHTSHKLLLHNMGLMVAMASAILASSTVWMMQQQQQSSLLYTSTITPFTAQELMWALRDGYVGTLLMHWWHHGGL
jgi:acyl-CoA synthetase (AMP-forming)/AMP-acid ligase II